MNQRFRTGWNNYISVSTQTTFWHLSKTRDHQGCFMIDFHDKFLYDAVINMDRDKWEIVCVGELVPDFVWLVKYYIYKCVFSCLQMLSRV